MKKTKVTSIGTTALKPITITRTKAIELIEGSKGRFMSLTCDTKTKKGRAFNCIYKDTTKTGHARVTERGAGIKAVNLQTLSALKVNGVSYKVK